MEKVNRFIKEVIERTSNSQIEETMKIDLADFEAYVDGLDLKKSQKKELKRYMRERHWLDMALNDTLYDLRMERLMETIGFK